MRFKLRIRHLIKREAKSARAIDRDIERGRFRAPHYDEAGVRYWWSDELDADDRRIEALKLGPKYKPPPPTSKRTRKPKAKPRIVAPPRRKPKAAERREAVS